MIDREWSNRLIDNHITIIHTNARCALYRLCELPRPKVIGDKLFLHSNSYPE